VIEHRMIDENEATATYRSLFLEISIVEHLLRTRLDSIETVELNTAQFGVLNYFARQNLGSESEVTLAWSFQNDTAVMAEKIDSLAALGFVETSGAATVRTVTITHSGTKALQRSFAALQQEIRPLVEDIAPEDAKTTLSVLRELRRTLDNLPDR
jgi:DNA-binding MarR family transcriptional regulator